MMKIELVLLGKTKDAYLDKGIEEYKSRIRRFNPIEIKYIKVKKLTGRKESEARKIESELLDNQIDDSGYRVALDSSGKQFSSEKLAEFISNLEKRSTRKVSFIIGGPLGLAGDQLEKADTVLSLSKMTFTHDMTRLILLEQIYRAYTIKAGTKYHK